MLTSKANSLFGGHQASLVPMANAAWHLQYHGNGSELLPHENALKNKSCDGRTEAARNEYPDSGRDSHLTSQIFSKPPILSRNFASLAREKRCPIVVPSSPIDGGLRREDWDELNLNFQSCTPPMLRYNMPPFVASRRLKSVFQLANSVFCGRHNKKMVPIFT